jgi:hypothetical protein
VHGVLHMARNRSPPNPLSSLARLSLRMRCSTAELLGLIRGYVDWFRNLGTTLGTTSLARASRWFSELLTL